MIHLIGIRFKAFEIFQVDDFVNSDNLGSLLVIAKFKLLALELLFF
jgi:hypothetical protein